MKKILVIGAGFLQSFIIQRAVELGYETYAVDGNPSAAGFAFADHYKTINIVDAKACLEYAKDNHIDGVFTAATDYGVLSASIIAQELGLRGIKPETANLIKNKYQVRKCLFDHQVDDTEQTYLVDSDCDIEELSNKITYPVMVKPCDGSGSRGASRVDHAETFAAACNYAMESSIAHRAVVETFIFGKEYGVESFVENGNIHILAVMKKWMTEPPYYAELGHAIPSGLDMATENKIKQCVEKALTTLGVHFGSVNMDVLVTDAGKIHIIDIGARMGGNLIGSHIIPLGTGIDYMGNIIKASVGDATDFTPHGGKPVTTRLLALTPGIVKELPDFEKIQRDYGVMIEHHLCIGDKITQYQTNLDGCGYVIACEKESFLSTEKAETVKNLIDKAIVRI